MYDVNPVPYGDELALNVDSEDGRISIPLAVSVSIHFGITEDKANTKAAEILSVVRDKRVRI